MAIIHSLELLNPDRMSACPLQHVEGTFTDENGDRQNDTNLANSGTPFLHPGIGALKINNRRVRKKLSRFMFLGGL